MGCEMPGKWTSRWAAVFQMAIVAATMIAGSAALGAQRAEPSSASNLSRSADAEAVATLRDPATGDEWRLLRGSRGGPGRWIRSLASSVFKRRSSAPRPDFKEPLAVRAGERLVVSEETSRVAVRVEVVALEPAAVGAIFRVRAVLGDRVLLAVALGAGRARLTASDWGRP